MNFRKRQDKDQIMVEYQQSNKGRCCHTSATCSTSNHIDACREKSNFLDFICSEKWSCKNDFEGWEYKTSLFFQPVLKGSRKVYFIIMNWTHKPWIFYNRIEFLLPTHNEIFTLSPQRIWLLLTRRDASQFCHSCHTFCQSLYFSRPFHFKVCTVCKISALL